MLIQIEVPNYVLEQYAKLTDRGDDIAYTEEFAKDAYETKLILNYLHPVNPDGSIKTENLLRSRIYSFLNAASSTILNLKKRDTGINTARDLLQLVQLAFKGDIDG